MIFMRKRPSCLVKALIVLVSLTWLAISTVFVLVNQQPTRMIESYEKNWFDRIYGLVIKKPKPYGNDQDSHAPFQTVQKFSTSHLQLPSTTEVPGEMGKPYALPNNLPHELKSRVTDGWKNYELNQYVSDLISVHRDLPDVRHEGCLNETYSEDLPKTSIIICFHNEAWSVLLRTIHSVLDRSPPHLVEEIILVDDLSDMAHLKGQLDDYVKSLEKVRLIRTEKREGLVRARLLGVSLAKGPVLTFLDSHCECNQGWLEPLLQRIHINSMTVVSPVVDYIDGDTFGYSEVLSVRPVVGGFSWDLKFQFFASEKREKLQTRPWDPMRSPAIKGTTFAIDKKYFKQIGAFDDGFEVSGGENLELSFRTWMCGGTLEIVPCSRVGHIDRLKAPIGYWPEHMDVKRNKMRIAEVWLDEYKWCYYFKTMNSMGDFGVIIFREELRKNLNCKSFDWYLKNVYPERNLPKKPLAFGEIRNLGEGGNSCLTDMGYPDTKDSISVFPCNRDFQHWMLTNNGEIRRNNDCLDYTSSGVLIMYPCQGRKQNQEWLYDPQVHSIQNPQSTECLAMSKDKKGLLMEKCTGKDPQRWKFGFYLFHNATNDVILS